MPPPLGGRPGDRSFYKDVKDGFAGAEGYNILWADMDVEEEYPVNEEIWKMKMKILVMRRCGR